MIAKAVAAVALLLAPLSAARAQFVIPGFSIMTPAQQNRQVVPYKRALTFCVIRQALDDSAAAVAFRDGSFETYVVTLIDRCPGDRRNLEQMYDRTYGQGQADPFINGAYAADLPEAVLKRIRPQLQAKVDDLNREEAARKADEDARAKQAEADQQLATARAEQEEATAKADADRAQAQERAAAQQAEAERLKQVEVANGAAKRQLCILQTRATWGSLTA